MMAMATTIRTETEMNLPEGMSFRPAAVPAPATSLVNRCLCGRQISDNRRLCLACKDNRAAAAEQQEK